MARVRITVPCPYCRTPIHLDTEQNRDRWRDLGKVKCDSCDSRCTISLKVNRSGKGKRWKELEDRQRAEHNAKVHEAEAANERTLAAWKLLDGCICVPKTEGDRRMYSTSVRNGIPQPPQHNHRCPYADRADD
jgi:hypothetical protein